MAGEREIDHGVKALELARPRLRIWLEPAAHVLGVDQVPMTLKKFIGLRRCRGDFARGEESPQKHKPIVVPGAKSAFIEN